MSVPHVATIHGGDIFTFQGRILRLFKQAALRLSDAVTVNSQATEDAVRAMAVKLPMLARIPMGVETRRPVAADAVSLLRRKFCRNAGPLLITIGRLIAEKGIGDVIEAVDTLRTRLPDISLMILGEGQDQEMFQNEVRRLGLAERVHFLGWVQHDRVPVYLSAADIFVGASRPSREGWIEAQGLTFLEAMAVGTPVIGTKLGGITDAIVDEETGLLVNAGAPEELAETIYRLYNEPWLREKISSQAKLIVKQRFSRKVSAERFSTLFQEVSLRRSRKKIKNTSTSGE
jgi:glycosyltransferase involved in cell wall biosynthesis